ncbi:glycosyltransferase 87 family protein [Propionibacteriaceae bacterium G57]|uniref:glycosyltransferase 87 family protein n=1 Tax=Aestuariimicrobium sp. G57 TaxID=3418485 RepID=UPI003DA717C9
MSAAAGRHASGPEPTFPAPDPDAGQRAASWWRTATSWWTGDGHGHQPPVWWRHVRRALGAAWVWILLFLLSRAWVLREWYDKYQFIRSDVNYYLWWLNHDVGITERLVEYPLPVVWLLDSLRVFGNDQNTYQLAFGLAMAALDAAFCVLLWRRGTLRALLFWNAFVTFFGALIWFRYDMAPAFVVGVAALLVTRHPRVSGALVALGAGLKLWPAMLIAPLMGRSRAAVLRTVWFAVTGAALAGLAFLHGGWQRLISPLTWQSDRGLQVESVPATWLMWQRSRDPRGWTVEMSKYNAFEIFGPGTDAWMRFSDVVMALAVLSAACMVVVVFVRKQLPADLLALAMTSIVLFMLVANKTLSPQYLLWLGTPVAALLALAHTHTMRARAHLLAALTLFAAFLTQQVYPVFYGQIIGAIPTVKHTGVLVARNALLLVMAVIATVWTWADLTAERAAGRHDTPDEVADDDLSDELFEVGFDAAALKQIDRLDEPARPGRRGD